MGPDTARLMERLLLFLETMKGLPLPYPKSSAPGLENSISVSKQIKNEAVAFSAQFHIAQVELGR